MTAAIYYHPEAYTTSGPKLMGRNAAGESFLRGFFAHSQADALYVQVQRREHGDHFAATARGLGRQEPVTVIDSASLGALTKPGTVYYPGPGIGEHAWHRTTFGADHWSLCGITHTTSSIAAMDAIRELITAPVQPWDAVICTSTAVKNNVERILQAEVDYLKHRLGVSKLVLPQLPVIPLGIHTQDFDFSEAQRQQARAEIGVSADTLVVLFMGRLSFHAKAHPLAMYQALQVAAKATGKKVVLVECGWHANDFIRNAYQEASALACPDIQVITLDGRKAEDRIRAWASADIFCSLSDNIQETFGIVPIEGMAAGLPVVVSDWDGYRDTVRDKVDGFRIPTSMPAAGLGRDLAYRHAVGVDTYDMYCGHTCSLISVDIEASAQAFIELFNSPDLRRQMGAAGRVRAREVYDWSKIIPQYETLWQELGKIRVSATQQKSSEAGSGVKALDSLWPGRLDPFFSFGAYATHALSADTVIALVDETSDRALSRTKSYLKLAMVNFAKLVLPSETELMHVLNGLSNGPVQIKDLLQGVAVERQAFVLRSIGALLKLGIVRLAKLS
jgi:glycosyltransferase involved in cell wall biosynthesis